MISVSGCSLSAGRAVSLLGACACGSHLSRLSRRSLAPCTPINLSMKALYKNVSKATILYKRALFWNEILPKRERNTRQRSMNFVHMM
ncbi:hypothetical protein [Fictibacillus sp. FJAT-27399]|uniref:hypothetical protein n=1 Tax=Fictibacillus sp. FJAT-27399 TaxID=1729689 RepID=UPI0012E36057|nr:hypothetical protein [Fictibacillus sp. FJAT-27399]